MLHCYYMRLNCDCSKEQSQAFYRWLPAKRKERIDRMKNRELARRKILSWAFLQSVICEETGIVPEMQRYGCCESGRPYLVYPEGLDFNLSDSGEYVVVALGDCRVGVDVEHRRRDGLDIARRCFCRKEYEDVIAAMDEGEQVRRFLAYWTMKEAYVKYEGSGLGIPLSSFWIDWDETGTTSIVMANNCSGEQTAEGKGHGRTMFLNEEYCISVCQEQEIRDMCLREKRLDFMSKFISLTPVSTVEIY